jgi:hypothetical protein
MSQLRTREERAKRMAELEKQAAAIYDELNSLRVEAIEQGDIKHQPDDFGCGYRVQRRG